MTRILHPIPALLASATRQDLAQQVAYLKEESRILGARLRERLVATSAEKRRLLKVGQKLGTQLKELMSFVSCQKRVTKPLTVAVMADSHVTSRRLRAETTLVLFSRNCVRVFVRCDSALGYRCLTSSNSFNEK